MCVIFDKWTSLCKKSKYLSIPVGRAHYFGEMLEYDVFFPPKDITFEGVKAYVPSNVEVYLRNLYGNNYMNIPPLEKRESHPYVMFHI